MAKPVLKHPHGLRVGGRPLFSGRGITHSLKIMGTVISGDRLRGPSPGFNFPGCPLLAPKSPDLFPARLGAHTATRGTSEATGSPGIGKFMTFPARASQGGGREGCQGPSRKCGPGLRRTGRASPEAGATGGGAPTGGPGEHPCPPSESPSLTAHPLVGGHFPPLPATLQTFPGAGNGRRRSGRFLGGILLSGG